MKLSWICKLCNKSFNIKINIFKHLLSIHNINDYTNNIIINGAEKKLKSKSIKNITSDNDQYINIKTITKPNDSDEMILPINKQKINIKKKSMIPLNNELIIKNIQNNRELIYQNMKLIEKNMKLIEKNIEINGN